MRAQAVNLAAALLDQHNKAVAAAHTVAMSDEMLAITHVNRDPSTAGQVGGDSITSYQLPSRLLAVAHLAYIKELSTSLEGLGVEMVGK